MCLNQIHTSYPGLNQRVQRETEVVRAEELRKKREREEAVRKMKEERQKKQEEEEAAVRLAATADKGTSGLDSGQEPPHRPDSKPSTGIESDRRVVNASYDGTPSDLPPQASLPAPQSTLTPSLIRDDKAVFSDLGADKGETREDASEATPPSSSSAAAAADGRTVTMPGSSLGSKNQKPPLSVPQGSMPGGSIVATGLSSSMGGGGGLGSNLMGGGGLGKAPSNGASSLMEVAKRTSSASRSSNKIVPVV